MMTCAAAHTLKLVETYSRPHVVLRHKIVSHKKKKSLTLSTVWRTLLTGMTPPLAYAAQPLRALLATWTKVATHVAPHLWPFLLRLSQQERAHPAASEHHRRSCKLPFFKLYNFCMKLMLLNSTVVPLAFLQISIDSSTENRYRLPEDEFDSWGRYVTRVDEHFPINFRIIRDLMLAGKRIPRIAMTNSQPVKMCRVGGEPEFVPIYQVKVTDRLKRLVPENLLKPRPKIVCLRE